MTEIKPIETEYKGHRFRSRLEARWSVVFDSLNVQYEYEPEGFEMPDGTKYLPDFYFPSLDLFCEVKPRRENAAKELRKTIKLAKNHRPIIILS